MTYTIREVFDEKARSRFYLLYDPQSKNLVWTNGVQQPASPEAQNRLFQEYCPLIKILFDNLDPEQDYTLREIEQIAGTNLPNIEKMFDDTPTRETRGKFFDLLKPMWPLIDKMENIPNKKIQPYQQSSSRKVSAPLEPPCINWNRIGKNRAKRPSINSERYAESEAIKSKRYQTDDQVARRLDVFPSTIDLLVRDGKLISVSPSDTNYITLDSLERLMTTWSEPDIYEYRQRTLETVDRIREDKSKKKTKSQPQNFS